MKNASDNVYLLDIYIYPLIIIMLPFRMPNWLLLIIGFLTGFFIDIYYYTIGIHTFVATFTAFVKPYLCNIMEPRGGYNIDEAPTRKSMGPQWYFQHVGILLLLHFILLFSMQDLGFSFIIIVKILYSYIVSMALVTMYSYLFNPRY